MKRSPLRRKTRLRQRSVKREHADHDYAPVRLAVLARDRQCVRCGSTASPHVHHIRRRSQGGTNDAANLVRLCADCHGWVHNHPAKARALGLLEGGGDVDPSLVSRDAAPPPTQGTRGWR